MSILSSFFSVFYEEICLWLTIAYQQKQRSKLQIIEQEF